MAMTEYRKTYSVCPICLKRIKARLMRDTDTGEIFLEKECPVHGKYSAIVWRGYVDMEKWVGNIPPIADGENLQCPHACGLCAEHQRKTCCTLLEVTKRCNLNCSFCFANGGEGDDVPLSIIKEQLKELTVPGETLVQLSGGEPTVRDDLPEIVAAAKDAGCRFVQINTNGIRIAQDISYLKALVHAGLSFVFLQFDGLDDKIYRTLRGRPLLEIKKKAIENCGACRVGVTLVPTLVPGVNTHQIGDILRFGTENSPTVRGVHYQPVSYFGRMPCPPRDETRFTLDQLIHSLVEQSGDMLRARDLTASSCFHPLCGFHGDFTVTSTGGLIPVPKGSTDESDELVKMDPSLRNRMFIGRRWERKGDPADANCACHQIDLRDMESFLQEVRSRGFTITSMYFQDAGNLDLERLRRCSLHVFHDGKKIPFCSYYLTPWEK